MMTTVISSTPFFVWLVGCFTLECMGVFVCKCACTSVFGIVIAPVPPSCGRGRRRRREAAMHFNWLGEEREKKMSPKRQWSWHTSGIGQQLTRHFSSTCPPPHPLPPSSPLNPLKSNTTSTLPGNPFCLFFYVCFALELHLAAVSGISHSHVLLCASLGYPIAAGRARTHTCTRHALVSYHTIVCVRS
jgi:hypothetical protein